MKIGCRMPLLVRRTWLPGMLALVALSFPTPVRAETLPLAVMGDSLSDSFALQPFAVLNLSWTDLIGVLREGKVQLYNHARAASTSADMRLQGQAEAVAELVRRGKVRHVSLIIGANDFGQHIGRVVGGSEESSDAVVTTLVENVRTALDTLQRAGPVCVVFGSVPDLGDTPGLGAFLAVRPALKGRLTLATREANRRLEALARERRIPVVDLYGLTRLAHEPLQVGGVPVQDTLFGMDGLHPSSLSSALLGNAILEAFHRGYGLD